MNMNLFKIGDIIIVFFILLAIVSGFFAVGLFNGDSIGLVAVIKQNDRIIKTILLDDVKSNEEIRVGGKYNEVILVEKGRIRFKDAICPDKVCVKSGWLSKSGQIAVCVPNRTMIAIEGKKSKVDSIAGWK